MSPIAQNSTIHKVKVATRLAMANRDLLEAADFMDALKKTQACFDDIETDKVVRRSLLSSAVVFYCKPFGANNGAGIAISQISISSFTGVDPALHTKLMMLRNKAVAHSDADTVPVQLVNHDNPNLMVVAELPFELEKEVSAQQFNDQILIILDQIQNKLHNLSNELRMIPGALGQQMTFTFEQLGNDETEQNE